MSSSADNSFKCLLCGIFRPQLVQGVQSIGCNAKHNVEQRLVRWLLICAVRAHTETLKFPHELIADMLGSTGRQSLGLRGAMKQDGLVEYTRGVVRSSHQGAVTWTSTWVTAAVRMWPVN